MKEYQLTAFGWRAKEHWREHRPKMYRALRKAGLLERALYAAQENTKNALAELIEKGVPYNQAWEQVREEWLLLPSEENVPTLGNDPARWELPPVQEEAEEPEDETIESPIPTR